MSMPASASERCPLCRRPSAAAHAPFCSAGCRDRDLLNWLGEAYAVPGPPVDPDETPLDKD
jgi:uncharacterized protein